MKEKFEILVLTATDGLTSIQVVPARGGIANSITLPWQQQARECLYCHDMFWDDTIDDLPGGFPFLFPICGRVQQGESNPIGSYDWQGRRYQMPIHGVSWWNAWAVNALTKYSCELSLSSNEKTLAHYPFEFKCKLIYSVSPGKIHIKAEIKNCGDVDMPFYAGFHPYFAVADKANTLLSLETNKRLQYNEQLTSIVGVQDNLSFPSQCENPELNEQCFELSKPVFSLRYEDGFTLNGEFDKAFRFCQLYNIPDKPFYCVEPWMNVPGRLNQPSATSDEDITFLFTLAPQQTTSLNLTLKNDVKKEQQ